MNISYAKQDGTHETLLDAGRFVRDMQHRRGILIGRVEEIALRMRFMASTTATSWGRRWPARRTAST